MKAREIIGGALFGLGLLVCMCAVGTLDYMDACQTVIMVEDSRAAVIKAVIGVLLMGVSFPVSGVPLPEKSDDDNAKCEFKEEL